MDEKLQRKSNKYRKDVTALKFLELCALGKTLTMIAHELDVTKEDFFRWKEDPRKNEFKNAFDKGMIACQAFHEARLQGLIREGQSGAAKEQREYMAVLFDDWKKNNDTTLTIDDKRSKMSNNELIDEFVKLASKTETKKMLKSVDKKVVNIKD